jgi:hypothetical protein
MECGSYFEGKVLFHITSQTVDWFVIFMCKLLSAGILSYGRHITHIFHYASIPGEYILKDM